MFQILLVFLTISEQGIAMIFVFFSERRSHQSHHALVAQTAVTSVQAAVASVQVVRAAAVNGQAAHVSGQAAQSAAVKVLVALVSP